MSGLVGGTGGETRNRRHGSNSGDNGGKHRSHYGVGRRSETTGVFLVRSYFVAGCGCECVRGGRHETNSGCYLVLPSFQTRPLELLGDRGELAGASELAAVLAEELEAVRIKKRLVDHIEV